MPPAKAMLQPGALIAGKYRIEAELGRGGMGAVYAARHVATGRRFAIKVLARELAGDREAEARFEREARVASAIDHPAIVDVYDIGREDGAPYMVMKLLEGETLGARLKRGPLAPAEAAALLLPVLQGVAEAHARGVLHRDLKPDNILLAREDGAVHAKVLDFGVSKLLGADAREKLTRTGVAIGTPFYMSPEQVRGERDIDARADVYALGVILYEALTGRVPFDGNNYADLVLRIITGNAPGIREHDPSLPEELEAVVARAMAVHREERYASAAELAAELARFEHVRSSVRRVSTQKPAARASSTPFTVEAEVRQRSARGSRRSLLLYALAAAGVLAASALWFWSVERREPTPAPSAAAPGTDPAKAAEHIAAPAQAQTAPAESASTAAARAPDTAVARPPSTEPPPAAAQPAAPTPPQTVLAAEPSAPPPQSARAPAAPEQAPASLATAPEAETRRPPARKRPPRAQRRHRDEAPEEAPSRPGIASELLNPFE